MPGFESSSEDVLGLWTAAPQAVAVSFDIAANASQTPPEGEVYRVSLPADLSDAQAIFDSRTSAFARMNSALDDVPARLDGLVQRTQVQVTGSGSPAVSFSLEAVTPEAGPEGDLLNMLAEADAGAAAAPAGLSFGISEIASQAWESAKGQFDVLIGQIDRDVLHFAWVETNIAGQLVARTTVAWTGDMQAAWMDGVDADQSHLHESTLQNVTLTRHLRLRLFVTVASGSVKVASLMAAPGGAFLALPAVFQYVTKILAQARELQSIQITKEN